MEKRTQAMKAPEKYNETVREKIKELKHKYNELGIIWRKLERSLVIAEVFGDQIFSNGRVTHRITGNLSEGYFFTVTDGKGEEFTRPIVIIPHMLWGKAFVKGCRLGLYGKQMEELELSMGQGETEYPEDT